MSASADAFHVETQTILSLPPRGHPGSYHEKGHAPGLRQDDMKIVNCH